MIQINAARCQKVDHTDRRYRIHTDDLLFRCHSVHHDPIHPGGKWLVRAGTPVVEHIEDLSCRLIRILWLDDIITALHEIRPRRLLGGLEHTIYLCVIVALIAPHRLILENQKEAPCQRLPVSYILDEADVIFP